MFTALWLATATASAEDLGTVLVRTTESYEDLGTLHVGAVVGTSFSRQERFFVGASGTWEAAPILAVSASAFVPMLRIDSDLGPWMQMDAHVALISTSKAIEDEPIELGRSESGGTRTVTTVSVPMLTRNTRGLGVGLVARSGYAKLGKETDETSDSFHLMPAVGLHFQQAVAGAVEVDGVGKRSSFRWVGGSAELLFDGIRTYEVAPADPLGRFGGRVSMNAVWGRENRPGMSGQFDFGYYPGGQGLQAMFGIGGGFNAL